MTACGPLVVVVHVAVMAPTLVPVLPAVRTYMRFSLDHVSVVATPLVPLKVNMLRAPEAGIRAPASQFAQYLPTLLEIAESFRINEQ